MSNYNHPFPSNYQNFYLLINWKSAMERKQVLEFCQKLKKKLPIIQIKLGIASSFLHQEILKNELGERTTLWAQDCASTNHFQQTGQITATMLQDYVEGVIVGHHEIAASNQIIHQKMRAAKEKNLKIVLCCGFDKKRSKIEGETIKTIIKNQLLERIQDWALFDKNLIAIAYEETGTINSTKAEKKAIISYIRKTVWKLWKKQPAIFYGGGITNKNCQQYQEQLSVDGFLVGREGWKWEKVEKMIKLLDRSKLKKS